MSDYDEHATVVINITGQHILSYTGQGTKFHPLDICTDILSHIMVCDSDIYKLHLLDQGGQFLSVLLIEEHGIYNPLIVCVGADINLNVRQYNTYKVKVYEYFSLLSIPFLIYN